MYVADDTRISDRARRFLGEHSRRQARTDEAVIRRTATVRTAGRSEPAPAELVDAMAWFEDRYGGLFYRVIGGNGMEYGLDGEAVGRHTPQGPAFTGIIDGDWTWGVDVLTDGRTAMQVGVWPYRIVDRSVDQRLEKHALLAGFRHWPHRTFGFDTETGARPALDTTLLPPAAGEATGPADLWWDDDAVAVEFTLDSWPAGQDHWTVRYFAREPERAADCEPLLRAAVGHELSAGRWCALCARPVPADHTCLPAGRFAIRSRMAGSA